MIFTDINILVYAFREDSELHRPCRDWLETITNGQQQFGIPELTRHGFVRVSTNPRIFDPAAPMAEALAFMDTLTSSPEHQLVIPGPRHWEIFSRLRIDGDLRANLVPDAYLAALAIEAGAELASCDRDFARFPGLRWLNPIR